MYYSWSWCWRKKATSIIRRARVRLLTCGEQNFLLALLSVFFLSSSDYLTAIFSRFTPICVF